MIHGNRNPPLQQKVNRLVFWYSFLMAFPALLIIQNVSVFVFPFLFLSMYELAGKFLTVKNWIQFIAVLFGIGAIISVLNVPEGIPSETFSRALTVLPNYLYWMVLILFFTTYARWIDLNHVFKGIFWGILLSLVYFYFLMPLGITSIAIFKRLTQNTFAFLLICYTPIVVWYAWRRYGFNISILILGAMVLGGFLSGSRSGSLLVLSGGVLSLVLNRKSIKGVFLIGIIGYVFMISIIDTELIRQTIFNLNPRTYDIIYNREKTLEEDRSYLTRLAQIEKATILFERHPFSGIGLNNFTDQSVKLPGKFEGAFLVVNKGNIDEKSAHNSYFGFLAEGGLVLIIPFLVILITCILWFVSNINRVSSAYKPIFISLVHMSIHLYFIYAILNVFAWFLIGLSCMVIVRSKK